METTADNAKKHGLSSDLPDNEHDLERLKGDNAVFDLPEVKDIPGQEHIRAMPPGEMADTTASSRDEEGEGLWDEDEAGTGDEDLDLPGADAENSVVIDTGDDEEEDDDFIDEDDMEDDFDEDESGDDDDTRQEEMSADVSEEEKNLLNQRTQVAGSDADNLRRARLDSTDADGELLNEAASKRSIAGGDLDVPGAELDDANEEIGEEDEENNLYSEADTD